MKKTPMSGQSTFRGNIALAWSLGILVSLAGCGSHTKTETTKETQTDKGKSADTTTSTDTDKGSKNDKLKTDEAKQSDPAKSEAGKSDTATTDTNKSNATKSGEVSKTDSGKNGADAEKSGAAASKSAEATSPMASTPGLAVDDLPEISAASKKIKIDTMPDKLVICTVNGSPITVADYKHEFKMREAQTQALVTARPEVEKQLLDDAKNHNITLTSDEKHRLLATAHKAQKATGDVLKNYMKENNLTPEAFDQKILDMGLALKDGAFQTQQTLLNELVDQQIFIAKARASGYTTRAFNKYMEIKRTPQYKRYLEESGFTPEEAQTQLINRQLIMMAIDDIQKSAPKASPEQIQKVYKLNEKQLQHGERVRLSQIIIAAPDKDAPGAPSVATQVKAQNPSLSGKELDAKIKETEKAQLDKAKAALAQALKPGADFAKLANTLSDDPAVKKLKNGGDIGYKDLKQLQPEFSAKVKSLKVGQVYPQVLKTQFGYHIIKCTAREGKGPISLAEVEQEISNGLAQQLQFKAVVDYLAGQHKTSQIKLSPEFQQLIDKDAKASSKPTK